MLTGKWFDETKVGDTFGAALTVTETHLVLAASLFGDFNPLHVDDELARKSRFGGRILHGPFTSALISAPAGKRAARISAAKWSRTPTARCW
jgi:acyl dehydratase